MKNRVLVTVSGDCPWIPEMRKMLSDEGIESKIADPDHLDENGLINQAADCNSVIAGPDRWTRRVFESLPDFKCFVKSGIGLDAVDVDSATRHGIPVSNTPGANGFAVAEMAVTMILSLLRRITHYDRQVRSGIWHSEYSHELSEQIVGLVGFGFIAQKVAAFLGGFGCRFLAYDIKPDKEAAKRLGVTLTDQETLFSTSDIISLHIPLTHQTRGLINNGTLAKMKSNVILVNTCRGGVINDQDLYKALKTKKIAAAGLDVFEPEPLHKDSPLRTLDNIQFSPHCATATYEAMRNLYSTCAKQIIQFYKGEPIDNLINPEYVKFLKDLAVSKF
jgi:phosphoglycerate dehydrogenase-like enzyme